MATAIDPKRRRFLLGGAAAAAAACGPMTNPMDGSAGDAAGDTLSTDTTGGSDTSSGGDGSADVQSAGDAQSIPGDTGLRAADVAVGAAVQPGTGTSSQRCSMFRFIVARDG